MSSILPEFEYDIFISYRQNDNRSGWVSEFVNYLNEELAATVKDPVSVYFDSNPHNGLLETHNVDKSLEGKLKCLIFIPILSQTYCDPKSFAWQHEFCAFNKLVAKDQFGRDIRLLSGNVTSRILTVKIHDLDTDDKALLEKEIEGVLRPIEFIFKSPGVNRPLRPIEDHPQDNLNKTYYRDQINKVANAIKEIINSLKSGQGQPVTTLKYSDQSRSHATSSRFKVPRIPFKFFLILAVILVVTFTGYWMIYVKNIFTGSVRPNSIIVLPFKNSSTDSSQNFFAEGITVDIITEIAKLKSLSTLAWNTSFNYLNTTKTFREVADETNVTYLLAGTVQKVGQRLRVNVQLVDPSNNQSLWATSFDREAKYILDIQKDIARNVAKALSLKFSPDEQEQLATYMTQNVDAYELFMKARAEARAEIVTSSNLNSSKLFLEKAIDLDPYFAEAHILLGFIYQDLVWADGLDPLETAIKAKEAIHKALYIEPNSADAYMVLGGINFFLEWNMKEAEANFKKSWELSNGGKTPQTVCTCAYVEFNLANGNYEKAISLINEIQKNDPYYPLATMEKFIAYRMLQDSSAMKQILSHSNPNDLNLPNYNYELGNYEASLNGFLQNKINFAYPTTYLASAFFKTGQKTKSDSILANLIRKSKRQKNIDFSLSIIYAARGETANAINWFKSAYQKHDYWTIYARMDTGMKLIMADPEVRNIVREMGLQ